VSRIKNAFTPSGGSAENRASRRSAAASGTTVTEVSTPAAVIETRRDKVPAPAAAPARVSRSTEAVEQTDRAGNNEPAVLQSPEPVKEGPGTEEYSPEDFLYENREAPAGEKAVDLAPASAAGKTAMDAEGAAEPSKDGALPALVLIILAALASVGLAGFLFSRMIRTYNG
ncbi:MAG: hypothetical protein JW760_01520, partial [Spirochaetales bacterium]|nr:hypothetical protein [Spirochaetales bacterium]